MAVLAPLRTYLSFYTARPKNTVNRSTLGSSHILQPSRARTATFPAHTVSMQHQQGLRFAFTPPNPRAALRKLLICIYRSLRLLKYLTKYLRVFKLQAAYYLQISVELTVAFLS